MLTSLSRRTKRAPTDGAHQGRAAPVRRLRGLSPGAILPLAGGRRQRSGRRRRSRHHLRYPTTTGPYGGANACASINGTHNGVGPPGLQGWRAAAIIGPGADADAAGGYAATIAHELGHVLYLDHTCNAHSIMHAKSRCPTRYVPSGIIPADYLLIRAALGRN